MSKKATLVTGGAGFIGSHIVDELIDMGYRVIVVDDLSGGHKENLNPRAIFIKASITNNKIIDEVFRKYKPIFVYHLAAYAAEGLSHFIRRFNYTNNLIGSVNIINACVNNNVEHLIFTSSIAVYGNLVPPMTEDMSPQPVDPYGIAKYAVEQDIEAANKMFGLKYSIFRLHNVYGERQNIVDKYRNVIGIFMNQIMLNKPLTIFGDGKQSRAFTYIRDISNVIARAPLNPKARNQLFNLGSDKPITISYLVKVLSKVVGRKLEVRYLPARREVKHAFAEHEKVKRAFDISNNAETPIETGLALMWKWAQKCKFKRTPIFKNIEIEKGVPKVWLED